ncbi:hypothetical protein P6F15_11845 [Thiopseudomonas alkaliphila]|uniref:hypothetical protein n=1 Tax=Thiopseudomonas alkaliphila TaxID=1697053 RepID=UPI003570FB63
MKKLGSWYNDLNNKQRWIIWGLSVPYAAFPPTGIFLGGIPWVLVLLYLEFHRGGSNGPDAE